MQLGHLNCFPVAQQKHAKNRIRQDIRQDIHTLMMHKTAFMKAYLKINAGCQFRKVDDMEYNCKDYNKGKQNFTVYLRSK